MNQATGTGKRRRPKGRILGCAAIFIVMAALILLIGRYFAAKSREMAYRVVDAGLEQNVRQIVADIDVFRENEEVLARDRITAFGKELLDAPASAAELVAGRSGDAWRMDGLLFAVWDGLGSPVYADMPTEAEGPEAAVAASGACEYGIFDKDGQRVLCMLPEMTIDDRTKEFVYRKIHAMRYEDNSYIWVNEIVNYEGGDGYAIRRIHPSLRDTEGMLLSTAMQDAAGGRPYLEELEGIKRDGQIWYSYYFKLPGEDRTALKETYAFLYEPFDWIICMGTYVQDIERYTADVTDAILRLSAISIAVLAAALTCALFWSLRRSRRAAAKDPAPPPEDKQE